MRRVRFSLVVVLLLLLCGCQARTSVDINIASDGKGSITVQCELDPQAAAAVPNLAQQLSDSDLKSAGWTITGPTKEGNGNTVIKVKHGFASPDAANQLMVALTGTSGPFQDFKLSQSRSISSVRTEFHGTVDLSKGIQSFGSNTLAQRFGNSLGFNTNEVQSNLGVDFPSTFPVSVELHMPGGVTSVSPRQNADGSWHLQYGAVTNLSKTSSGANVLTLVYLAVAGVLGIVAIALAIFWKKYVPMHRGEGVRARDLLASEEDDNESV